jgi:hypothetical protein
LIQFAIKKVKENHKIIANRDFDGKAIDKFFNNSDTKIKVQKLHIDILKYAKPFLMDSKENTLQYLSLFFN